LSALPKPTGRRRGRAAARRFVELPELFPKLTLHRYDRNFFACPLASSKPDNRKKPTAKNLIVRIFIVNLFIACKTFRFVDSDETLENISENIFSGEQTRKITRKMEFFRSIFCFCWQLNF